MPPMVPFMVLLMRLLTGPLMGLLMSLLAACAAPPDGPAGNEHEEVGHEETDQEASDRELIDWMFDGLIRSALDKERHRPTAGLPSGRPPEAPDDVPGGAVQGDSIQGDSIQGDSIQAREMQRLINVMTNPDMPRPRAP